MSLKLGIVIDDTWAFFHDIYRFMTEQYDTSLFMSKTYTGGIKNKKINDYLFNRDLRNFLKNNDVVFFEWPTGLLAKSSLLPKTCGIVTRMHRYELYQWAEAIEWNKVDKLIVVSEAKKREFAKKFPDQAHKLVVIPEGINIEQFTPSSKQFTGDIGILCHLTPRKRVYELILAFFELIQTRNDFHLHIGGGSRPRFKDYVVALRHLVEKLNLDKKVTFYDNVENPQDWYKKIDIFISNSYSEGLQVAPMEAMASGIYCLSHYWDGADELLPQKNLYFTDRELINSILSYTELTEDEKISCQKQMRMIVENKFDIKKVAQQICSVLDDIGSFRNS